MTDYWDHVFDVAQQTYEASVKWPQRLAQAMANGGMITQRDYAVELAESIETPDMSDDDRELFLADVADNIEAYLSDDYGRAPETLGAYQQTVRRTIPNNWRDERALLIFTLGLCGEAGELADHIKKVHGHDHDPDRAKVVDELGDVLWYLTAIADWHGIGLGEIAERNAQKLWARYPDGFDTERSRNRAV